MHLEHEKYSTIIATASTALYMAKLIQPSTKAISVGLNLCRSFKWNDEKFKKIHELFKLNEIEIMDVQ